MIPPKLKIGHHIRIISTPGSDDILGGVKAKAIAAIEAIGLTTSFSQGLDGKGKSWIDYINEAFLDTEIHGLLLATGIENDNNFNQIDCVAFKAQPKIIAGLAEAPLLSLYLYQETGIVNYFGPNLKMLGMSNSPEQCVAAMKEILMINASIRVYPSTNYGTGQYQTRKNDVWVLKEGKAEGQCFIGGSFVDSFSSIDFYPDYCDKIIFICGNHIKSIYELDSNIKTLMGKIGGENIAGLIIGGIEEEEITFRQVNELIKENINLSHIPVLANVNLFKSDPKFTLPIGGSIRMNIRRRNQVKIDITVH